MRDLADADLRVVDPDGHPGRAGGVGSVDLLRGHRGKGAGRARGSKVMVVLRQQGVQGACATRKFSCVPWAFQIWSLVGPLWRAWCMLTRLMHDCGPNP